MKFITLLLLLSLIPSGLLAQKNSRVEALAKRLEESGKKPRQELLASTVTYREWLTKLMAPLKERQELVVNQFFNEETSN